MSLLWPLLSLFLAMGQPQSTTGEHNSIRRQKASIAEQRGSAHTQRLSARRRASRFSTLAWSRAPARSWRLAKPACGPIRSPHVHDYIDRVAAREGLTPELLRVVIHHESGFRPCAVSPKGALGLMQLMPQTAAELGVRNPFDPKENIDGGARYLSSLLRRFEGDVALALAAYNAGPARVTNHRGLPPIPETRNYVSAILAELRGTPARTGLRQETIRGM